MTTREFGRVRQAVLLGLFAGTGVGLGYLLSGVPGVELMTTNAALAGLALGPMGGLLVGLLSQLVYSLGSPFGPPVPLMLAAQLAGMGLAGAAGGLAAPWLRRGPGPTTSLLAGALGLAVAVVFDLLTNLAIVQVFAMSLKAVLVGGAAIMALHLGVVATAWAVLLPLLARRLSRLRSPGPRAVMLAPALLVIAAATSATAQDAPADSMVTTPVDTLAVVPAATVPADSLDTDGLASIPPDSLATTSVDPTVSAPAVDPISVGPELPEGWTLPLWKPFHATLEERLLRQSAWLPVRDGGAGSAAVIMGEPGTSVAPEFRRDGIPMGVGHRYLDDQESWSLAGRRLRTVSRGLAGGGALHGVIALEFLDPVPDRDLLDTHWYAGAHETRLRQIQFLTADAPWRVGFDFYEHSDRFGYDFRTPGETRYPELEFEGDPVNGWGNAAVRAGRGRLMRTLADGGRVTLSLENTRKHRHGMMIYDIDQQELWRTETSLTWQKGSDQVAVWFTDSDVILDSASDPDRLIEGVREGVTGHWEPAGIPVALDATYMRWSVRDSGFTVEDWAPDHTGPVDLRGEDLELKTSGRARLAGVPVDVTLGGWWAEHGGLSLGGKARLGTADDAPGWQVSLERGGRAPRSDELATPWRAVVPGGRQTVMLPNRDLEREQEWRLAAAWQGQARGWDYRLGAAHRRLRHGIGWEARDDNQTVGQWRNGVELDATTVEASVGREGRCLGWGRIEAEAAWHGIDQIDDLVTPLPPAVSFRLSARWEQRFFQEDGITQLGAYLHNRGAMDDPWALSRPEELPSLTVLDVILGFRLVGTSLSAEVCNVLGAGEQLSASGMNEARELRWRIHWVFHH